MKLTYAAGILLLAAVAAAQPLPPFTCPGNLLQNPSFSQGVVVVGNGSMPPSTVASWTSASQTPQVSAGAGCSDAGFIAMWGNQAAGEAIRQTLGAPLTLGKRYRFTACARFSPSANKSFVNFRVRASNGPLPLYTSPGAQVGITPNITSTAWASIGLTQDWIATGTFNTITINPTNGSNVNLPTAVVWGHIDRVCLREIPTSPCTLDPGMINASNTFARPATLAQTFTPTASGQLTKITHGLQHLSGSTSSYKLMITTTSGGVPTWPATTSGILYQNPSLTIFATSGVVNGTVNIPPAQQPILTAGTLYALVLVPIGPGSMAWRGNSSPNSYTAGSAYELNGNSWTVPSTGPKDHGFIIGGLCP